MLGIIITGHGQFGKGLTSSLEMIAGAQPHYEVIDFLEENPLEKISDDIDAAIIKLKEACDGVLIFTDLFGGTPFKSALMLAQGHKNVVVFAGTNLGMLIEAALTRSGAEDVLEFARSLEETGKEQVQMAYEIVGRSETEESEDGI